MIMDLHNYERYMLKGNLEKSIHTLEGILKGIGIDCLINEEEVHELNNWLKKHMDYSKKHPFNELIPKVKNALEDGTMSSEEKEDLLWLCNNLHTDNVYYNTITSDIQRLHGLLHGVLADGVITDEEIRKLSDWVSENEHIRGCFPFDEIDSLITVILSDGKIEDEERTLLKEFLEGFIVVGDVKKEKVCAKLLTLSGVCAMCPEIIFEDKLFCLTGESPRATKMDISLKIENVGGKIIDNVRKDLDYLIVLADGNSCWAFSCYGRKVEKAMKYRKDGLHIVIAHENDLWDAIADKGLE